MAEHGVTLELFYDGVWNRAPILTRDSCKITRGTNSPGNDTEPASATVTIDNTSGDYAPLSVASALHGKIGQNTPARLTVDGSVRISGEVAEWRPERPIKGSGWTRITIAGVLRRIGRGTDPIQSAVTRGTLALDPVAYWPLEAMGGALTDNTAPLVNDPDFREITWADSARLVGSLPLPKLAEKDAVAPFDGSSPFPTALTGIANATSAAGWSIGCWVIMNPSTFSLTNLDANYLLQWGGTPAGAVGRAWELYVFNGPGTTGPTDVGVNVGGNNPVYYSGADLMDGQPHHVLVTAEQTSANNITVWLYVDGVGDSTGTGSNPQTPRTLAPVSFINAGAENNGTNGLPDQWLGHVAVFDRVLSASDAAALYAMGAAYSGETAADRFTRICTEQGITATVVGTAAESVAMGPQLPLTVLDEFDEIARTDDAQIFETRNGIGLTMRTGVSKLNQAPDFTINYLGEIEPPLTPVVGDEGIRNDVTARSPAGAERRVQQLTGPHNVADPGTAPQAVGRYKTSIDVNPSTDAALGDAAGRRVSTGTFAGTWYAEVTVDLDAAPGLIATVNGIDIGDCIALANLPVDEALDTVESIVIGIMDDVPAKRRLVTFYCVPAEPYRVGTLALTSGDTDPIVGHLDTDGSTVSGAVAAGASSFSVATTSGPLWTVDADDFPQDVIVGGQRVSVSSITGASSPQTFNVRSAALGGLQVRYPIASGAAVNVQQPVILAL